VDRDKVDPPQALPARQLPEASHDQVTDRDIEGETGLQVESIRLTLHQSQVPDYRRERPQIARGDQDIVPRSEASG
jgi:hypothetical protein